MLLSVDEVANIEDGFNESPTTIFVASSSTLSIKSNGKWQVTPRHRDNLGLLQRMTGQFNATTLTPRSSS